MSATYEALRAVASSLVAGNKHADASARLNRLKRSLLFRAKRIRKSLSASNERQWCRVIMDRAIDERISQLPLEHLSVVEISGERHAERSWLEYQSYDYPAFDLCSSTAPRQFDLVICEQVLEHVPDPRAAAKTLRKLCKPGGTVIVSTPFLVRLHPHPFDYWRFSSDGLRLLLEDAGLEVEGIGQWGNRSAARANLYWWVAYRWWRPLRNEEESPLVVWAFAHPAHKDGTPE